ncbi:MarP family serine protease [Streptomyces sp. DSM 44915]|uniref:MarP family serine protease n=1 Tax=Streptomyces chisholmiae TaxID=3075540 RepID=A0ABU2JQC8_9ACTN|nr:MarP family serine protease [Streptomyces sp. DSM 44915]MDT0266931.1 MarP family serine protease [Streptomyces sp. DSM 44915]
MNVLDVSLLLAAGSLAAVGYRRGLLLGVCSALGLLAGALLAVGALSLLWPTEAGSVGATGGVLLVVTAAVAGQVLAARLGGRLRALVSWPPARAVDAAGGALVHALALLLVAWLLGSALALVAPGPVGRELRSSQVLFGVSRALPAGADGLAAGLGTLLVPGGSSRLAVPIDAEPVIQVPPPDPAVVDAPALREVWRSVVRVRGSADGCGRTLEGTGFVFADGKVLTNAHVVGGVTSPAVSIGGLGRPYPGEVVHFDPERDLAVLDVPGLPAPALPLSEHGGVSGDDAVVVGFPESGPFTAVPARVRDRYQARGPDIYRSGSVSREVYSLHATIRPGNSGGPLLSPDGEVLGVVFARSLDDGSTGYALTADEVREAAGRGQAAERPVTTGRCAPG